MIRSQKELSEAQHPMQALSQSERFILRYNQLLSWIQGNTRTVAIAGAVAVLLVVGLIYYFNLQAKNNELASTYLTRVEQFYQDGDYRHAIDGDRTKRVQGEVIHGLKEIVDNYGSTVNGSQAALFLANSYYYLGKYDSAAMAFDKAITVTPVMQASVEAGHAAVDEAKGNKEEAAKLFLDAASHDKANNLDADYLIDAARDYQQIGNKEEAVKVYKQIIADYQNSQFDDYAKRALLQMNVSL